MPTLAELLQYPADDNDPLVTSRPPPTQGPIDALRAQLASSMRDQIAARDRPWWSTHEHPTFAETTKRVLDPEVPFSQNLKEALLTLAPSSGTKVAGAVNSLAQALMAVRGANVAPRFRGTVGISLPPAGIKPEPVYGWRGSFGYEYPEQPFEFIDRQHVAGQETPPIVRSLGTLRHETAKAEAEASASLAAQGLNRWEASQQPEKPRPRLSDFPMVF